MRVFRWKSNNAHLDGASEDVLRDAAGEGAWDPADQGDWSNGTQQQWAPAGEYGSAPDGQGDWAADGHGGQGGWIPDGHGGWAAAEHDGWSWPGQEDVAHAGENGWSGQDGWADQTGQAGWGAAPGGASAAAPAEEQPAPAQQPAVPAEELAALAGELAALAEELAVPTEIPAEPVEAAAPAEEPAAATKGSEPEPDDTSPLPVIRDTDPPPPELKLFSVWEPAVKKESPTPETSPSTETEPEEAGPPAGAEPLSADTQQRLEKIKDLYLTAEAIGEEALVKHFDQVSKMQRSLISEFFEEAGLGPNGAPTLLAGGTGDEQADSGKAGDSPPAADRAKAGWRAAVSRRRPRAPASQRPTAPPPPR